MMPVVLIFAIISPLLELCTATAVHHRLAQGWANAYNTIVGRLLCFLSDGSRRPKIHAIVRSLMIFGQAFERLLWRKEEMPEQAI